MFLKTDRDRQRLTETDLSKRRWLFAVRRSLPLSPFSPVLRCLPFLRCARRSPFTACRWQFAVSSLPFGVCRLPSVCRLSVVCRLLSPFCRLPLAFASCWFLPICRFYTVLSFLIGFAAFAIYAVFNVVSIFVIFACVYRFFVVFAVLLCRLSFVILPFPFCRLPFAA